MATRTWVSGVGDDANPGSRTAPCKTFAGAMSKTDPGGEINVIDPGGFGTVTINKTLTIDGGGAFASILAAGTTGITVAAGPNDVVTIRNLSIDGAGTGINGINFVSGAVLHIENCVLFNFSQRGVAFQPGAASRLFIKDTIIRNNNSATNGGGVLIGPGAGGSANATLDNVRLDENLAGVTASDRSVVVVRNCIATGSVNAGFVAAGSSVAAVMNLENCVASDNNATANTAGILSAGAQAVVRISNVMVVNNSLGLFTTGGGAIVSFGNNRIAGNTTDGAPTSTPGQK